MDPAREARATRPRWSRPARRSTWRPPSSPRATGARTRSPRPARSCAPTIPAAKLRELIDKELAEEGDGLTWEKDFASWLGEDAGIWATNFQADEPSFALIVASKDAEAAKAALARFAEDDSPHLPPRSYEGIDYKVDDEGVAGGVVDDFLVFGTEDAFKRSVDTRDGDKLVDSDRYKDAIEDLEEDRLGHYYVDVKPLIDAALKQDPEAAQKFEQFKSLLPLDKLGPITGAFTANGDGMALDTIVTGVPEGPFRDLAQLWSGDGSELMGELPGDAWGAFVTPKRRRVGAVDVLHVRRRDRRRGGRGRRSSRRPAWTSSRTSSPGSATSACSCAAPTWRRSTARS